MQTLNALTEEQNFYEVLTIDVGHGYAWVINAHLRYASISLMSDCLHDDADSAMRCGRFHLSALSVIWFWENSSYFSVH